MSRAAEEGQKYRVRSNDPRAAGPAVSGARFSVVYHLAGSRSRAAARAEAICVEQTVEFPADLLPEGIIREHILGRVDSMVALRDDLHEATISYAVETVGSDLTQLLNVFFGNMSLQPGVRLDRFALAGELERRFRGPRFGRTGLRQTSCVPERPLLCTALKPMGLSPVELAALATQFARGGIDLIKDDHGLADQPFCRFRERVARCCDALAAVERETAHRSLYFPNVTAPAAEVLERALFAKECGARGLLVAPGLVGFDTMRSLADDERLALPIISHPALLGSFVTGPAQGISHFALFGQLMRLAGADGVIFPSYGGRFSFSRQECSHLVAGTECDMGPLRPLFPIPAGGMTLRTVPEMLAFYGRDVILLIGGDLHRHGPDLMASCQRFKQLVSAPDCGSG